MMYPNTHIYPLFLHTIIRSWLLWTSVNCRKHTQNKSRFVSFTFPNQAIPIAGKSSRKKRVLPTGLLTVNTQQKTHAPAWNRTLPPFCTWYDTAENSSMLLMSELLMKKQCVYVYKLCRSASLTPYRPTTPLPREHTEPVRMFPCNTGLLVAPIHYSRS